MSGTELEARVEIQQLKELEVFDSLRLSIVAAAIAAEVLAVEIASELVVELVAELLTEVKAMDTDRKNLYIIGTQSLIESIRALLLYQGLAKYCLQ